MARMRPLLRAPVASKDPTTKPTSGLINPGLLSDSNLAISTIEIPVAQMKPEDGVGSSSEEEFDDEDAVPDLDLERGNDDTVMSESEMSETTATRRDIEAAIEAEIHASTAVETSGTAATPRPRRRTKKAKVDADTDLETQKGDVVIPRAEYVKFRQAVLASLTELQSATETQIENLRAIHSAAGRIIRGTLKETATHLGSPPAPTAGGTGLEVFDLSTILSTTTKAIPPASAATEDGEFTEATSKRGRRRTKKIRDPNRPVRPGTSYLLFCSKVRDEVKGELRAEKQQEILAGRAEGSPTPTNQELLMGMSRKWKALSEAEQGVWKKLYQTRYADYSDRLKEYIRLQGDTPFDPEAENYDAESAPPAGNETFDDIPPSATPVQSTPQQPLAGPNGIASSPAPAKTPTTRKRKAKEAAPVPIPEPFSPAEEPPVEAETEEPVLDVETPQKKKRARKSPADREDKTGRRLTDKRKRKSIA